MNKTPLTATQTFVLSAAAQRPDFRIEAFPENVKGGARDQVLQALRVRGLIRIEDNHPVLTEASFSALGLARPSPSTPEDEAVLEQAVADAEASWMAEAEVRMVEAPVAARPRRQRAGTKQATLIEMLSRPQGASIAQLSDALGWQAHSVRGALVTVIRQFGLTLQCEKVGGVRIYRAQAEAVTK